MFFVIIETSLILTLGKNKSTNPANIIFVLHYIAFFSVWQQNFEVLRKYLFKIHCFITIIQAKVRKICNFAHCVIHLENSVYDRKSKFKRKTSKIIIIRLLFFENEGIIYMKSFLGGENFMQYSHEVEEMICVAKGAKHDPAPIPEEGKWVPSKEIKDISGLTHGIGWCAPQQGTCKLTLNVKDGVIQEALVETIGCSGMTHSAAMAAEVLPGKTVLEALNTDLVCDAINVAMRELFLQIAYGRTQTAFSEGGLPIGAGMEDLGKGLRSQVGTMYSTAAKGVRYLEMAEGYVLEEGLDENNEVIGYKFVHLGKMMEAIKKGMDPKEAYEKNIGTYGRYADAKTYIDPRKK